MDNHRGCKTQIIAKHSKTKTNLLKKRKKESPEMQYIELGNNKKCVNLNFTELVPQYLPDFTKETHPNSTAIRKKKNLIRDMFIKDRLIFPKI